MASFGYNFRGTDTFVTDGANETYVLNEVYPTTRGGSTFGWDDPPERDDRNASLDRRLAGAHKHSSDLSKRTFRADLATSGNKVLHLSVGDADNDRNQQVVRILDTSTQVLLLDLSATSVPAGSSRDASNVTRTDANWPSQEVGASATFATTILYLELGSSSIDMNGNYSSLRHLNIVDDAGGGPTTVKRLTMLGVG